LLFTTSVDNATRMAELFNGIRASSSNTVNAKTQTDLRKIILRDFEAGAFQYMPNVGIATEGYDCPPVACIGMGRPTKSRSLYAQMIGRGLRPIFPPGFNPNTATADERKAAIAASVKPCCRVIEFTGNSGKHELACAVDILGGKYDEDVVKAAKKKVRDNPGLRPGEALETAQKEITENKRNEAARKLLLQAKTNYTKTIGNPFDVLHIRRTKEDAWSARFGGAVASEAQVSALTRFGVTIPAGLTKYQASKLIGTCVKRRELGLCTFKQVVVLERYGVPAINLSFSRASEMMDAVKKAGWKRPPQDVYERIAGRERTAGEDG
jgi:hypothetical protein